jgi:hypothetical protein
MVRAIIYSQDPVNVLARFHSGDTFCVVYTNDEVVRSMVTTCTDIPASTCTRMTPEESILFTINVPTLP